MGMLLSTPQTHQAFLVEQGPHKTHIWVPPTLRSVGTLQLCFGKPELLPDARVIFYLLFSPNVTQD